jgi:hypothetical protein
MSSAGWGGGGRAVGEGSKSKISYPANPVKSLYTESRAYIIRGAIALWIDKNYHGGSTSDLQRKLV